ncbi:MAG: hypothetical protein QM817_38575 [Archangium sp.]
MFKNTLFGVVLAAALAGCGVQPPCDASTCSGCCDAEGLCQSGNDAQACGFGASACGQCAQGFNCTGGICIVKPGGPSGGGGGGGTTGGGGGTTGGGGITGGGGMTGGGTTGGGGATGGGGGTTGGGGGSTGGGGATGGGTGGGGPTCGASGASCGAGNTCCNGLQCIAGTCGTCSGNYPTYCPQEGGGCWTPNTVCSTVVSCGGDLHACGQSVLSYSCTTGTCGCPSSSYPVYCAPMGSLPAQCWSPNTDCTTRTQCGSMIISCHPGYTVDCATGTCVSNTPTWLAGTYSKRGKTENNVDFTSDNRSLTLRADGTFSYTLGNSSASSGTFTYNPTNRTVSFTGGGLSGTSTGFGDSCRTVSNVVYGMYRSSEVANCPTSARVPSSSCTYVGRYRKTYTTGSISSSGSGTETDWTDEVVLSRDGFYTIDSSSFRSTCYAYNCHYSSNRSVTLVGTWTASGGAGSYTMSSLRGAGWVFTPSTATCPGP